MSSNINENLGSLLENANSDDDLSPENLSGDENAEKSLIASDVTGKKSNFLLTVTTVMKTVIGAGIISLPFTMSKLGYVLGLLIIILVIIVVQFSSIMLLKAKNLSKHSNYSSIGYHIFRNKGIQNFCYLAIVLNNLGLCIVELTILKETIEKIIESYIPNEEIHEEFYLEPAFILCVVALLEIPFTIVNKMEKLKMLAFLGVGGISLFVISFLIIFFSKMNGSLHNWRCDHRMVPFGDDIMDIVVVIPNLMISLSYQTNFFPIFKGMKNVNDSKMRDASIVGICSCSIFYILVGYFGYCLFGNSLRGNFLMAFERKENNDALYLMLNFGFLLSVFFSFPIMFFGARNNFIAIAKNIIMAIKKQKVQEQVISNDMMEERSSYIETENREKRKRIAKVYFYIYTAVLFVIAVIIAVFVKDIEDVFSIVGSIAANALSFILPSMFYCFLIMKKNKTRKPHFYIAGFVFIYFIPFGIFSMMTKIVY